MKALGKVSVTHATGVHDQCSRTRNVASKWVFFFFDIGRVTLKIGLASEPSAGPSYVINGVAFIPPVTERHWKRSSVVVVGSVVLK